jgi:hypothetical protein
VRCGCGEAAAEAAADGGGEVSRDAPERHLGEADAAL